MGGINEEERLKSDGRATDADNYIIFRIPTGCKSLLIKCRRQFRLLLCYFGTARLERKP